MNTIQNIYTLSFSGVYLILLLLFAISMFIGLITRIPFVPTTKRTTEKLIKVAKLKKNQKVLDLGCGDGRLLFAAEAEQKISAIGYEISPIPYLIAKIKKFLKKSQVKIKMKNFLKEDISSADIIFVYLIPDVMPKLSKKLKNECKKGTKIISNTFRIKELEPTEIHKKNKKLKLPNIYVYEI